MLAKLSMTPRDSRADMFRTAILTDQNQKLKTLYEGEKIPTPAEIIIALGGADYPASVSHMNLSEKEIFALNCSRLLDNLTEADWILLVLLCDKCTPEKPNALLYTLAQQLLDKTTASPETKLSAFYFLKSQNQPIELLPDSDILRIILQSNSIEAWATLLSDENTHPMVFSQYQQFGDKDYTFLLNILIWMKTNDISKALSRNAFTFILTFFSTSDHFITELPGFIRWMINNDKDNLKEAIAYFANLQRPEITKTLIALALNNVYKLTLLREGLASSKPIEGNPLFSIIYLEKNLAKSNEDEKAIITIALSNLKSLEREWPEKISELFNVFLVPALRMHSTCLLFVAKLMYDKHPELLSDFVKLTAAMPTNPEVSNFLADTVLHIANTWKPIRTPEELKQLKKSTTTVQEIFKKDPNEYTAQYEAFKKEKKANDEALRNEFLETVLLPERLKLCTDDMDKGQARGIQQMLTDLLATKDVLDAVIEKDSHQFSVDLQRILSYSTVEFFNLIFRSLWNQVTGERTCSTRALHWLLDQPDFQSFKFIDFLYNAKHTLAISSNAKSRLQDIFRFNDPDVIKKIFEQNALLSERRRYASILSVTLEKQAEIDEAFKTQAVYNPYPTLNATLRTEPPALPLFLALTIASDYADLTHALIPLLTHPDFHIERYYEHSSEAFKQLPQVKAAMQLQYFFHPETVRHLVEGDESITNIKHIHHLETFFHELKYRHLDALHEMTTRLSNISFTKTYLEKQDERTCDTNEALYQKARSLHYQIKQLPDNATLDLHEDVRAATFAIAHRTLKYERVDNPTHDESAIKSAVKGLGKHIKTLATQASHGHKISGKNAKIPFFRCILEALVLFKTCDAANTLYPDAPFIWHVYVDYLKIKRAEQKRELTQDDTTYRPEKMAKVNTWLTEQIFRGEKTVETLGVLSEKLLRAIFAKTNVAIGDLVENSKTQFLHAEHNADDDEPESTPNPIKENTVSNKRTSFFARKASFTGFSRRSSIDEQSNASEKAAADTSFIIEDLWDGLPRLNALENTNAPPLSSCTSIIYPPSSKAPNPPSITATTKISDAVISDCNSSTFNSGPPPKPPKPPRLLAKSSTIK